MMTTWAVSDMVWFYALEEGLQASAVPEVTVAARHSTM